MIISLISTVLLFLSELFGAIAPFLRLQKLCVRFKVLEVFHMFSTAKLMGDFVNGVNTTYTSHPHHPLIAFGLTFLCLFASFGSKFSPLGFKENRAYPTGSALKLLPIFLKSITGEHPLKTWHLLVPQAPEKQSISTLYFSPVGVYSYLLNLYCNIRTFMTFIKMTELSLDTCPPSLHIISSHHHHTVFLSPHPIFS